MNARAREKKAVYEPRDLSRGVGTSSCFSSAKNNFARKKCSREVLCTHNNDTTRNDARLTIVFVDHAFLGSRSRRRGLVAPRALFPRSPSLLAVRQTLRLLSAFSRRGFLRVSSLVLDLQTEPHDHRPPDAHARVDEPVAHLRARHARLARQALALRVRGVRVVEVLDQEIAKRLRPPRLRVELEQRVPNRRRFCVVYGTFRNVSFRRLGIEGT